MNVRKLGWLGLSVLVLGCPSKPAGDCGGETCAADQVCDQATLHCVAAPVVTDAPPVVTVVAPPTLVSSATFVVTGKITDDLAVTAAEWKVGTGAATPITLAADGAFSLTIDAPLLDSQNVVVTVTARDAKAQTTVDKTVKIDRVGPTVQLVRPASTEVVLTPMVEVAVNAVDGSGTISTLSIAGITVPNPASGVESVATLSIPTTLTGDVFSFEVIATDPSGNQTSQMLSVTIDRAGPVITFVSPLAGSYVTSASLTVSVDVTDLSGVQSVSVNASAAADQGSDRWTADVVTTVEEADRVITVTATDTLGNITTATRMVKIDRIAPTLSVTVPAMNSVQTAATVALAVTTSADTGQVIASIGGNMTTLTGGPASWTTPQLALPPLDDVTSAIHVVAQDLAGNTAFIDHPIVIDSIAPTVIITAPLAMTIHRVAIPVGVTTAGSTAAVTATLEGVTVPLTGGPIAWVGSATLTPHDYAPATLRVTVQDNHGNSSFQDLAVFVDTVNPVITFTAPIRDQKFKASDFASGPNVTTSWTITDGDPQAASFEVNFVPSTALSISRPTSASDNPTSYTTNVAFTDRAGNSVISSISYTVDRVAPTVVSWTPAANTRNVEPWESVITFSEPVSGALPASPALAITAFTPTNDVWSNGHATYRLPLDALRSRVLDVSIASVADDSGNPVATATRRFHLATGFASPSTTTIATGIQSFDATSDSDGVLTVAVITTGGTVAVYKDTGGGFTSLTVPSAIAATSVSANSTNVVNGALQSSHRLGVTTFNSAAAAGIQYGRSTFLDGVIQGSSVFSTPAAIVSRAPLANEPVAATALFGNILGTTYSRAALTRTLPNAGVMVVAPSNDSWAAFETSSTQVLWSHYRCRALIVGGYNCKGIGYGASASTPMLLQAAMTPAGNCLATTWTSGTTRQAVFQPLSPCDLVACFDDTALPLTGAIPADLRVASYGANGENTLLFSHRSSAIEMRLSKMTAGTCGTVGTTLLNRPSGKAHAPIRVGNRAGLLYIDNADQLQLAIP